MVTIKVCDIISVLPVQSEGGSERCVVTYAKSGKIEKRTVDLTARALERKLKTQYYLSIEE